MMTNRTALYANWLFGILLVLLNASSALANPDWLLTGFLGRITNVATDETTATSSVKSLGISVPAETFEASGGFGVNLASVFPAFSHFGFEADFALHSRALSSSNLFLDYYSSGIATFSANGFFSPAVPRVRPYLSGGPTFIVRRDRNEAVESTAVGTAVGMNVGGGILGFVSERFAARADLRYTRSFGDFTDSVLDDQGWKNLRFLRFFIGGTVVLH
jgi:hypothetical protein